MSNGIYKGPKTLSVMPTNACPAACADCGSGSNPRAKERLLISSIDDAIEQAAQLSFMNVVFTGGEPTLRWAELLLAIAKARQLGLSTRVVTNAHWAHTRERAYEKLLELRTAGLVEINFSTGDQHALYVPVERVAFAAAEAARIQYDTVHIMVELHAKASITEEQLRFELNKLNLDSETLDRIKITPSPWMPLQAGKLGSYDQSTVLANQASAPMRRGCDSVLQTYTVQPDGCVTACCGIGARFIPELTVADVQDTNFLSAAVERAEDDFMKLWLRYSGPEQILAWASSKNKNIVWENMYAHKCQACHRIYSDPAIAETIDAYLHEILPDIIQTAWLEEEYIPLVTENAHL